MKKNQTRRALLLSALSLLLCVSMLVGTTFAWFTDSVTSGRNTIQSGNLDVVLEYWDGNSYEEVTSTTKLFNDAALWEPGYTEVAYLKVSNAGSLALKYQLAVSVYNEILGKTKTGEDIKLSDHLQFKVVESETDNLVGKYATREAAQAANATATKLQTYNSKVKPLDPKDGTNDEDYVALIIYMPTTVGNEANHDGVNVPKIEMGVNLFATQQTAERDSFNDQYDKNAIIVTNAAEAQAALDNAEPGTTIKLAPGVNYGTLVFNQNADSKVVDITAAGGDAAGNEHYSKYENITIIGAPGAIVDRIDFNAGWIAGSGASFIDIKNLTIKDVTFSGASTAVKIPEGADAIAIDGLSLVNCKMIDTEGNDRFVYQPRSGYKAVNDKTTGEYVMTSGVKNLTITGCEITGAHQVIEARAMENLTITNNTFNGIKSRDILLGADPTASANGITYTGTITITGNTSINGEERFVRGAGMGDANVIIKDNTILNYMGKDADYIKVTDSNGTPVIENNTLVSIGVKDAAAAQAALDKAVAGTTIQLQPGVNYGTLYLRPVAGSVATKEIDWIGNNYRYETYSLFEDLTIVGAPGAIVDVIKIEGGTYYNTAHSQSDTYPVMLSLIELKNVVIDGVTFTGNGGQYGDSHGNAISLAGNNIKVDGLTIKNCVLEDPTNNNRLLYKSESTTHIHTYEYDGATYTFTPSLKDIVVTNCTFNGGYMGLELRETENVTITNNVFNVGDRNILLTTNSGCTYTVNVTITGNVSNNAKQRFVRADAMGDAVVVVANNTINNYMASDADYIKVTNGNNVTVENNTKN